MSPDLSRYHRQTLLPGFGEDAQRRLLDSKALVLGCGALGTVVADMLARAGVGHIVIADRDFIELTNLQRQVLFDEQDVADAIPKAEAAKRKIAKINSQVEVTAVVDDINPSNLAALADGADVLVDGLDNFETRYLANDYAVKHGVPYVYGGAVGTSGMALAILPHTAAGDAPWETLAAGSRATPCFRCLFEEAPPPGMSPTCDTVGVVGPLAAMVANYEAAEALKILTGNYGLVSPRLLNVDLWANAFMQLDVSKSWQAGECPCCGERRFEYLDGKAGSSAVSLCGRNAVQLRHRQQRGGVDIDGLAARLAAHGEVRANPFMLRAHIAEGNKDWELTLFPDGRAIVKGTDDIAEARSVYSRYVGA